MKKIFLVAVVFFSLLLMVAAVSAQGLNNADDILKSVGGENGEKIGVSNDLASTIATVIKTVLAIVGTIFLILTVYAGIMWMTAAGNDEQVTKAVGIIKAAVIGLIIIMSAYAITYFVTTKLVGPTNNAPSPQPQISCSNFTDQSGCLVPRDTNGDYICAWSVNAQTGQGTCETL